MKKLGILTRWKIKPLSFTVVVAILGTLITLFAYQAAINSRELQCQALFEEQTLQLELLISKQLDVYVSALRGTAGLFRANEEVSRKQFTDYIESFRLFEQYPAFATISFVELISGKDRDAFVRQVRADKSVPDLDLSTFSITPPGNRDEYFVVNYVVTNGQPLSLGFDFGTDPVHREALEQARDTGLPVASRLLTLIQSQDPGFLIMFPVYKEKVVTDSVAARRAAFLGTVNGTIQISDIFKEYSQTYKQIPLRAEVQIYEGNDTSAAHLLFDSTAGQNKSILYSKQKLIQMNGLTWTFLFSAPVDFGLTWGSEGLPIVILVTGLDFTLLICALFWQFTRSNERAVSLAREMVRELREHDRKHSHTRVEPFSPQKK